jgi:hypothetical protein
MSCTPFRFWKDITCDGMFVVLPGNYHDVAQAENSHPRAFMQDSKLRRSRAYTSSFNWRAVVLVLLLMVTKVSQLM